MSTWAQPCISPDASVLRLDQIGVYDVGYAYRGQEERPFPLGWSGMFEEKTGIACLPYGEQNGREAFLLHCPWRGGTGITYQQFNLCLPVQATRIVLRGATAMKSDVVAKSDGVTFRVFLNGANKLEWHQTNDVWRPFEFDLTSWRGSNVLVRFEVDPGPANNAAFDYSLWGSRELILEGFTPPPLNQPAPVSLGLTNVVSAPTGEVAPVGGFTGIQSVHLSNDVVYLRYTGPDGAMEYEWHRPTFYGAPLFGTITLNARMTGQPPVTVPLANSAALVWTQEATPVSSVWQETNEEYALVRTFRVGGKIAHVRIAGRLVGKSLVLATSCDLPRVSRFNGGVWGPTLRRRQIVTPYYSGKVYFLPHENLFVNAFLDWTASAASSQRDTQAIYAPLTDSTHNRLAERIVFSPAWNLDEVLPNIPNPPSPWRSYLANRMVLDVWGGSFTNIARNLLKLGQYGITNCVTLVHVWQRSGYDNALPNHYPANAGLGGDAGLSNLVATATRLGMRVALHENYVDYYPNYDHFSTNDIALDSSAHLKLAWFNEGTGIQAFAEKPTAILRLAATQSPEIHARYHTEADFLDVCSAVPPWFHVDFRANEPGAGKFATVWKVHRELWDYERATHHGPVFGEGNRHWYWSGFLDGVEAQFGTGWPVNGGLSAPLCVDFDLLKIHPLQLNHGMGYYQRWWPKNYPTNWAALPPMIVLDQYRMQEVAFGHSGYLGTPIYNQIPLAWLEYHLLTPVTARSAEARAAQIQYDAGGSWLDTTAFSKQHDSRAATRVRVTYNNGLTITANGDSNRLSVGAWTLPQFGWIAVGAGVTAGTILRDGVVTDFADTGDTLFVNARADCDWNLSGLRLVRPNVAQFQQIAPRKFEVTYRWDVRDKLKKDYRCFVHFTKHGTIRWQQDHRLKLPTSDWQLEQSVSDGAWTVTIPKGIPDGDYEWLMGLYDPDGGTRLRLLGVNDGSQRIRLGVVHVRRDGAAITFTAEPGTSEETLAWYHQHLNESNRVVDFGDVRTDGSALLHRDGNEWVLQTWPRERRFTLELSSRRFSLPARIECVGGQTDFVEPTLSGSHWSIPLNGASEYHW